MAILQLVSLMLVGFAIGLPVAYSLLAPAMIYLAQQHVPLFLVVQKMANGVESFPLLAVPFFIAAGEMMNTGGVTRRLVNLASTVVGHITGGLAHVTVVANMIMAGMSGSAIADAAGTGRVLIPAMEQERFSRPFAAAIVSAAGTIGPIIPPSIPFVLFGFIASTSVGRLFLGGIIPGILMGLFLMLTAYIVAKKRHYPRHPRATIRQFWNALKESSWALVMPLLILGGILTRDMVASWGATSTPIPMADIFTSLQSGIVDGQENPYPQILSNRFYEVQKYLIHTAHIVQTGSIIFNESLFQAQPKEFQKALIASAQEAVDWYLQFLTSDESKMLEQLKGYGMAVVEPDVKAFREATTKIYDKYDQIWTKALREKIQNYKI